MSPGGTTERRVSRARPTTIAFGRPSGTRLRYCHSYPAMNRWAYCRCPSGTRIRPSGLTVTCRCHYIPRSGKLNNCSGSDSHWANRSSTSVWRWLSVMRMCQARMLLRAARALGDQVVQIKSNRSVQVVTQLRARSPSEEAVSRATLVAERTAPDSISNRVMNWSMLRGGVAGSSL